MLSLFLKGKNVASYSDDENIPNKHIFQIPALFGIEDGYKHHLSSILACGDTDLKVSMLEEYFGVCLLPFPEILNEPDELHRIRDEHIFRNYLEHEIKLTGKKAPISIELISQRKGKLFIYYFSGMHTQKDHCYLLGYVDILDVEKLTPVSFQNGTLIPISLEEFQLNREPQHFSGDNRFNIKYGTPVKVTFTDLAPSGFTGKTMLLPVGFYPYGFDKQNRLLLIGYKKIVFVDNNLKLIAKMSVQGDIAEIHDNYILTTSGESFYAYCYNPKSIIRIYKIVDKNT